MKTAGGDRTRRERADVRVFVCFVARTIDSHADSAVAIGWLPLEVNILTRQPQFNPCCRSDGVFGGLGARFGWERWKLGFWLRRYLWKRRDYLGDRAARLGITREELNSSWRSLAMPSPWKPKDAIQIVERVASERARDVFLRFAVGCKRLAVVEQPKQVVFAWRRFRNDVGFDRTSCEECGEIGDFVAIGEERSKLRDLVASSAACVDLNAE